jgi:hypothetical protein
MRVKGIKLKRGYEERIRNGVGAFCPLVTESAAALTATSEPIRDPL